MTFSDCLFASYRLLYIRPGCAGAVFGLQSEAIQVGSAARQANINEGALPTQPLRDPVAEEESGV